MEKLSCSLTCRNFQLPDAASFVRCSSVLQKSLCALNLSILEFSLYKRHITKSSRKPPNFLKVFFYREEEIRKFLVKDRKIMYSLHLDIPLEREPSLRDADFVGFIVDSRSFHIGSVSLPHFWYREKLQEFVLQSVKLSNEKLSTLSRIFKNERKIHSYWESSLCVVRYDLGIICFESNHTGIAKGAIIRFDVRETALDILPRVSEIHTYGGFQAQGHIDHDIYILHEMIMDCTFEFIPSLLRHGFALKFDDKGYKQLQESLIMDELLEDEAEFVAERKMSTRRSYLLMQVLHISSFIDDYPELCDNALKVLRMIWRSIPDPVLSRNEIQHAYNEVLEKDYLNWLITIYQHSVDEFPVKTQPRSLKHLARASVRKALSDNQKLPDGLDCIGLLPPPVLALLRLEE